MKNYRVDFTEYQPILNTFNQVSDFKVQADTKEEAKKLLASWFAIQKGTLRIIED